MPYKSEKIAITNEKLDRRVKLTTSQKDEIFQLYSTGNYSLRTLALLYNVSKRTIHFIVKPETLQKHKIAHKERARDGRYYDTAKNNQYMKNHRRYKQGLFNDGLIGGEIVE